MVIPTVWIPGGVTRSRSDLYCFGLAPSVSLIRAAALAAPSGGRVRKGYTAGRSASGSVQNLHARFVAAGRRPA